MSAEFLIKDIPTVAVLGEDRVTAIHKDGEPDRVVDWQVTHREDRVCVDHGTRHVYIEYAEPDGTEGTHEFKDRAETLTVSRVLTHLAVAAA